jgi:hypothetical protein
MGPGPAMRQKSHLHRKFSIGGANALNSLQALCRVSFRRQRLYLPSPGIDPHRLFGNLLQQLYTDATFCP